MIVFNLYVADQDWSGLLDSRTAQAVWRIDPWREKAQPRKMGGKSILVVNASHWMSEIGSRLSPDCDFAVIWYWDHESNETKVSLRAFHETVDVSEIAKSFGGGGHKKAAGFQLPKGKHIEDIFDKKKTPQRKTSTRKKKGTT